ncbi:response regulator transcription factor [Archangium sp.]|uniref:response regulator transcription factor n=1 Tax=Archangium sp. TaxID=1872627 RepID=UPI00389B211E
MTRNILDALSRGRSHKEVAAELGVAYFTVTTHVRNLFLKLGVNNRVDAINAVRRARPPNALGAYRLGAGEP